MSDYQKTKYYAQRALEERRMMEIAYDWRAIVIHAELAARYEALASDPSLELPIGGLLDDEQPMLRSATG